MIITIILIASANTTFCHEMLFVIFAMLTASGIAFISEFINTTSAASIAASAPLPIAAPTSAPASTGASLIPSPTNITAPWLSLIFFNSDNLSCGSNFACTSSIPVSFATASALSCASPVSIAVMIPCFFTAAIASFASSFTVSEITMFPTNLPFNATRTSVPKSSFW